LILVKKAVEEFASRKSKFVLEEGSKNHNFFGIRSRDVLALHRSPLEHGTVGEEMLFHQREEIALCYRRFLKLLWVGGSHHVEEGNPSKEVEECAKEEMCARKKTVVAVM
jgi:hypothetical protein